jgi:hypothetical protein
VATDSTTEEYIYRAMVEDSGTPRLGVGATKLGVRPGIDIDVDAQRRVHRPSFQAGTRNGVSCAPSPEQLPDFARPRAWGGNHPKTTVWRIRKADLGPDLVAEQDKPDHVSIGPARTMAYNEYVEAIQATASRWIKVTKGGG